MDQGSSGLLLASCVGEVGEECGRAEDSAAAELDCLFVAVTFGQIIYVFYLRLYSLPFMSLSSLGCDFCNTGYTGRGLRILL